MPSARFSELIGSLRFRLSAWNTAVVVVTVLVALFALREGLRYTLIREADLLLLEDIDELGLAVKEFYPDLEQIHSEMNRKARGHEHRQLFVQVLDPQGSDVWSSVNTPTTIRERPTFTEDARPRTIEGFRIVQRQLRASNLPAYTIRIGSSLAYVDHDIAQLSQLMLLIGAALLIAAPLGGYFLAKVATEPLREIIATAAQLHPSQLSERLPLRHTGDELDQLSATINGLLDRIAAYLERNREFTANAAHELRSPLAAIRSAVEVALNAPRTPQEYHELLCDIVEQIAELSLLVNQLLILAESDSAEAPWRRDSVRLDQLVARALDMFQGVAEERGIRMDSSGFPALFVQGDAARLREVINNLIDNSLKFTPRGGTVDVDLDFDPAAHQARLRVSDSGAGIDADDLPHIFERFYRGDRSRARESQTRGNGLGLSICLAIVTAHGGRIDVDSTLGRGTTFVVRLPAQVDTAAESRALSPTAL
jgi:heavy metal sensor kinase